MARTDTDLGSAISLRGILVGCVMCVAIALFPQLVTWLPETLYTK